MMAAKGVVLHDDEEWAEPDDSAWKDVAGDVRARHDTCEQEDTSRLPPVPPPAQQRRGRVTFQREDKEVEEEEQQEEGEEEEDDEKEQRQYWHQDDAPQGEDGGFEESWESADQRGKETVILDGEQEVYLGQAEAEEDGEEAGDEDYDGEADDNDWQEDEEEEEEEEQEQDEEQEQEQEQEEQKQEDEYDERECGVDKKAGDGNKSAHVPRSRSIQEEQNDWPSPVEAAETGPRRWVSAPRPNAFRKGTLERPAVARSPQSILRSTGNNQAASQSAAGATYDSAHVQQEVERLNKENWALRLEIGQERYRVQQLESLKEQATQARQRELEARRAQAIAVRELEQAQGSADRRDEFTKSERAQLLQHIEELEQNTQQVLDQDSALRLQLQEALAGRAGAQEKEDAAARELARWKKEALDHATKLKLAEQRLQQLEQKHTDDRAKIKALTAQLRSSVVATVESANDHQLSKQSHPKVKDVDPAKPRRMSESPAKRNSGRQPQQGSGKGAATLNGKEHREATTTFQIASRTWVVAASIAREFWMMKPSIITEGLGERAGTGVASRGTSKAKQGSTSSLRKREHVAAPREVEPCRGAEPELRAHVKAGTEEALAAAKQMQVLGVLVIFIIGMAVVKLLV